MTTSSHSALQTEFNDDRTGLSSRTAAAYDSRPRRPLLQKDEPASPQAIWWVWESWRTTLLGPIGGILIADYFVVCKRQLDLDALYDEAGEYHYTRGFSVVAIVALIAGILPSLPGFLEEVKLLPAGSVPGPLAELYHYAWFVGFGVAFVAYLAGRRLAPARGGTTASATAT